MRTLQPPLSIDHDVFVVVWEPVEDIYILALPDGRTYELGTAEEAFFYFRRIGIEMMGQRGIDCARNFYTAVVLWKEGRCYGAETKESQSSWEKFFKEKVDQILIA